MWITRIPDQAGPLTEPRDVVIAPGGVAEVAETLRDAQVIDSPFRFKVFVWLSHKEGALKAAEFAFPARASLRQVVTILRTARPVDHFVTIPEGLTASQIKAILDRTAYASGTVDAIAEGSVLPETYAFERGLARNAILARAKAAMERELQQIWASRAPDLPLESPRDLLILASIVERETSRDDERPRIAAVYLNRLRIGMKLQADPTVVYAVSGKTGFLDRKLGRVDLDYDDPFNTYRNAGLPPGPICSPGVASLRAVAHPMKSEDLFFVADGQGGHVFSRTAEAHARNVAKWRSLSLPVPPPVAND
jgi:UPF0755 protein